MSTNLLTDTRFVMSITQEVHASHTMGTCTKLDKSNICGLQFHSKSTGVPIYLQITHEAHASQTSQDNNTLVQ